MALVLGDTLTDRIDHGTGLGNWTACSWAWWYYPTTLTELNHIFCMLSTGSLFVPNCDVGSGAGLQDEIRVTWRRSAGGSNMIYQTNNAGITVNKWWYVCVTIDQAAGAGVKVKVYVGDLSTLATARTFGTATDPSSGFVSNNGATFFVGDNAADATSMGGRHAVMMMWPGVVLTEAQAQQQQFSHLPIVAGCKLHAVYGYNGTGTQPDWSGNANNGTVQGTTAVADHVPLTFRKHGSLYVPYAVAAPPGGNALLLRLQAEGLFIGSGGMAA
jgi:hypothetical protein